MDKIELIFNIYKDSVIVSKPFKREMIKKYRLSNEEIRNLYVRIQNYQIKNYGGNLKFQERAYTKQETGKNSNLSNGGIGAIILYSESERKGAYG